MNDISSMHRGKHAQEASIFIGYSFKRGNPQPWNLMKIDHIMVNAFDILHRDVGITEAHKLLSYEGEIFCDSGGWQILQGFKNFEISTIVDAQEQIGADYTAVLDHGNDESAHIRYLRYYLKNANFDFVPIIPYDMSTKNIEKIRRLVEQPPMIGIGKLVPLLRPPIDYEKLCRASMHVVRIRDMFPDAKLHIFGLGGLYAILVFFLIADSCDSSSWIHDARYGKVRLLGGPGTYSTHPREGLKHLIESEYHCKCPICKKHSLAELDSRGVSGLKLRASHNAWVISQEEKIIRKRKREGTYLEYVEERLGQSPHHRRLLSCVKKHVGEGWIPC